MGSVRLQVGLAHNYLGGFSLERGSFTFTAKCVNYLSRNEYLDQVAKLTTALWCLSTFLVPLVVSYVLPKVVMYLLFAFLSVLISIFEWFMVLPFVLTMRYPVASLASFNHAPWWSTSYLVISVLYISYYYINWEGLPLLANSYLETLWAIPTAIFDYFVMLVQSKINLRT